MKKESHLERDCFEEQLAEQAKLNEYSAEISSAVNKVDSLAAILQSCAKITASQLDQTLVQVWVVNEVDKSLDLVASAGLSLESSSRGESNSTPGSILDIDELIVQRKPHISPDTACDTIVKDREWVKLNGITSIATYPLILAIVSAEYSCGRPCPSNTANAEQRCIRAQSPTN